MKQSILLSVLLLGFSFECIAAEQNENALSITQVRVCVTGHDTNRPDHFPGLGKFGWPGNIVQLPSGELMLTHSAGYWHVSFAQPRLIAPKTRESWQKSNWPLDFPAPTGGRSMLTRSADHGKTWDKPKTIVDLPWDDTSCGLLLCRDGSLLCCINVQASWYGFEQAPEQFRDQLTGLNTRQCVVRSTDEGKTWSEPIWIDSPGDFYERSHSQPIELPDGGILWPTYCSETGSKHLFGVIHRSDDSGRSWQTISTIRRKEANVDEPAIARLSDGGLILVTRPDGGMFYSDDVGITWTERGRIVKTGRLKAPRMFVLSDGTPVCVCTYNGRLSVFLGSKDGSDWSKPISLDNSAYGYPGGLLLADDSILVSYCSSGRAPSDIFTARFQVNNNHNGITLLPVNAPISKRVSTAGK